MIGLFYGRRRLAVHTAEDEENQSKDKDDGCEGLGTIDLCAGQVGDFDTDELKQESNEGVLHDVDEEEIAGMEIVASVEVEVT